MGFFSWLTADKKQSIPNAYSRHKNAGRNVYLLQPNGEPPILETDYAGYGEFGGVDAFIWLARHNLGEQLVGPDSARLRTFGIILEGEVSKDKDGKLFSYFMSIDTLGIKQFEGSYDTKQSDTGKTPNQMHEDGDWIEVPLIEVIKEKFPDFEITPLKFSFDPNAVYENLPASKSCPAQGFFY